MPHGLFHHSAFADAASLALLKNGSRISVCIPTLNEAATIAEIVATIRRNLMVGVGLVDELLIIDSGSTDGTRELAASAGAVVHLSCEIVPSSGTHLGKGENLWKALHVATGDIICYIDGDISNFHPRFVTGLIGPLLTDPSFDYVKAHYERPLGQGCDLRRNAGGRVSEILIRPLLSLFYPELTAVFQPLSGEYAARRELLESLSFPTGYGIEIAHLIDIAAAGKLSRIAQTDLDQRIHRNRTDEELGKMSFGILKTIISRLQRDGRISPEISIPDLYRTWNHEGGSPVEITTLVSEPERPPVASVR
ncbi:MAG TPA: glucosyl-3-phosphoglycerate synthase [Luteolibacter sp.]|nr:glucosyl-3-phosphoglycerate synthase [Luteolibacter sp.]